MFSVPLELPEFKVVNHEIYSTYHVVHVEKKEIMLTVLGFNLMGDGLRDALDPRMKN
jgi:ABC-type dipeptide/oligopeptide/nickel transport system permease subunit